MRRYVSARHLVLQLILSGSVIMALVLSCADKDNPVVPVSGPTLTVSLDSTLDGAGTVLAESIVSASLTDTAATVLKTASVSDGRASFSLTGMTAGNYFITINDLPQARVPTRIIGMLDTIYSAVQLVGRELNASLILVDGDTLFRIETFFGAQGGRPLRRYSDGTDVSPEKFVYAINSTSIENNRGLEIRVDSTAELLVRDMGMRRNSHPQSDWILGEDNHGKGPAGNPDSTNALCQQCHANYDMKPMQWRDITPMRGYCFKCHFGSSGVAQGFIDPHQ